MAELKGTKILSPIVPTAKEDNYPTHESKYGKGGWHEVDNVQERDNISRDRLAVGMAVHVVDVDKTFILKYLGQAKDQDVWEEVIVTGNITLTQEEFDAMTVRDKSIWYFVTDEFGVMKSLYVGDVMVATRGTKGFDYKFPLVFEM